MRTGKTLIRLGGCPGWSESSLGVQSFWFCHEAAQIMTTFGVFLCFCSHNFKSFPTVPMVDPDRRRWPRICGMQRKFDLCSLTVEAVFWTFEPRHDKTNKVTVRPAKTQISLGIRLVWSESSLSAWRKLGSLATHWAQAKTDQTRWMPRLIWDFAGRTLILLVLSCRGSFIVHVTRVEKVPKTSIVYQIGASFTCVISITSMVFPTCRLWRSTKMKSMMWHRTTIVNERKPR